MFCLEFATSTQAHITRYLSMHKMNIMYFVSTQRYGLLLELQEAARRREIEMELHTREQRPDLKLVGSKPRFMKVFVDHLLGATILADMAIWRRIPSNRP